MGCRRLVAEDPHGWLRGDTEETHGMREGFEKNTKQLHLWGCNITECNIGTVSHDARAAQGNIAGTGIRQYGHTSYTYIKYCRILFVKTQNN